MKRAACLLLLALAPLAGAAEIYRCQTASGPPRFSSDPAACAGARPEVLERELQRMNEAPRSAAAPAPQTAPPAGDYHSRAVALEPLFVPVTALPGGWEIVNEAILDPEGDGELLGFGVRAVRVQHYTRAVGPRAEVCSVEIWSLDSASRATEASRTLSHPGWRAFPHGRHLAWIHGTVLERGGQGFAKGLFPACHDIGERIAARMLQVLPAAPTPAAR